jgi:hypothetical protein
LHLGQALVVGDAPEFPVVGASEDDMGFLCPPSGIAVIFGDVVVFVLPELVELSGGVGAGVDGMSFQGSCSYLVSKMSGRQG